MTVPTHDELIALCAQWQRRLELLDWHIEIRFGRARDVEGDAYGGLCTYCLTQRWAKITVRALDDYPPDATVPADLERTVVHELLHLHAAPFAAEDDSPADIAQEQMINALSRALVAQTRGHERYRPVPWGVDDAAAG